MNQIHKSTKRHPERGITLISLIVTIIILVILTAIVVKTITGDNSLIGATTSATENYKIEQYKELISAEVLGTIQTDMIRGEKTTLEGLAENIKKNIEGVVDAAVNQDETLNNKDILVTTEEGYIFQVIYDEETGNFKIEYGGKGDIEGFPRVVATYNKATSTIEATASISKGKIISLELIFNGESLKGDEGSTNEKLTRKIAESGLYQIKATADNGKTRSAYIRVTDIDGSIAAPNIEITKGVMGQEGWYKSDLEITISLSDETATEIHYKITNSNSVADVNNSETAGEDGFEVHKGNTITVPISTLGSTTISAYASDGKTNSGTTTQTVKFDNVAPTMTLTDPGTGWKKTDVSITVSGQDQNSGIAGYTYYLNGATKGIDVSNINTPITITREGTNTIKVQTKDKAGNVSNFQEKTIKIDKTGPVFNDTKIEKREVGATSFKVAGYATDNLSGIAKYTCKVKENGTEVLTVDNTIEEFEITGRKANTRYEIEITAIDNAGNESETPCTGEIRTVGELKTPELKIEPLVTGAGPTNGYYRSGIKITLTDTATNTTATSLKYEIVNQASETTPIQAGEVTNYATFDREGNYKIRVWAEDADGNQSPKSEWTNFGIDTAAPTPPSISLVGTNRNKHMV